MKHEVGSGSREIRVALFCSGMENIGQTTTLLNVARLMAAAGRRVLVVDAGRTDTRSYRYLESRLRGMRIVPGGPADNQRPALPDPWEWKLPVEGRQVSLWMLELGDAADLVLLPKGEEAADAPYYADFDTVLIDAPMPQDPEQRAAFAPLAHVLATCFTPNSWSVEAAAGLAASLREQAGERPFAVVAVGLQADRTLNEQLRLARDQVRTAFSGLGTGSSAPYVEIPYDPLYDQSPTAPDSDTDGRGLITALLGAEPDEAGPAATRDLLPTSAPPRGSSFQQLVEALEGRRPGGVRRITLAHPPRHHAWAEWIGAQLSGAGVVSTVVPFAEFNGEQPDQDSMLLVLSPTGASREQTAMLTRLSHPNVRIVLVDGEPLPALIRHHEQIDLRAGGEAEAVALLRRALRLPVSAAAPSRSLPFPRLLGLHNLAPRNPRFTGHDGLCEQLRERFASVAHPHRASLLTGQPGVGKSALALEFCHRFGGAYDLVWWLPAGRRDDVERGIGLLGQRLGVFGERAGVRDVVEWLGTPAAGRWLLVFDDADEPAALDGLLPACGEGRHLLLTSRKQEAAGTDPFPVPPLEPDESRSLLLSALPELDPRQADQVGQVLGRVPLTVRLAGSWIGVDAERRAAENQPRAEALRDAADELVTVFTSTQQELLARLGQVPLHRVMVEATLAKLGSSAGGELWAREECGSAGMEWLLECCALLAPSGADLRLLGSPALVKVLTARFRGTLSDPLVIDVALWTLARHGLLDYHSGRPKQPVRLNRAVRELVLGRLTEQARTERERDVRAVVAGYQEPSDPAARKDPTRIDARTRRLRSLRMWDDDRPEVRQELLRHLIDLTGSGERRHLREALDIGHEAAASWQDQPLSPEFLRLHNQTARARRQLGEPSEAGRDALVALRGHRRALGIGHPRTLLSADSYGGIQRADGEFTEARTEGRGVVAGMTMLLGPDHSATAQTVHNLALSEALCGDYRIALELLQARYARRRAIGGPDDDEALGLVDSLALVHRGLGQNRESFDLLKQYLHRTGGGTGPDSVNVEIGLAVSERRLGQVKGALERDTRVLDECRARFGDGQLRTERCRFSLAADQHAVGDHPAALTSVETCWQALADTLGDLHPFTLLCGIRVGVHQRAVGNLDGALLNGKFAWDELSEALGPDHPWTAAAAVSLAGTLVALGQYDPAYEKESSALLTLDELGLAQHPDRALVARNRRLVRRLTESGGGTDARSHQDIDLELPGL